MKKTIKETMVEMVSNGTKVIVLGTNNKGKIKELSEMLGNEYKVMSQSDIGFDEDVDEVGNTFHQNSLIKAQALEFYIKNTLELKDNSITIIADDSGLIVDALPKQLGVRTARLYSDYHNCIVEKSKRDDLNNELLLKLMKDKDNKNARYKAVVTCIHEGKITLHEGNMELELLDFISNEGNGFAFDFMSKSKTYDKPIYELTNQEKNLISHRGQAMTSVIKVIK